MEKLLQTLKKKPIFLTNVFCLHLLPNDSKLLENQAYITETKLSSFNIEDEDIYKIIKTLDIKVHEHSEVPIRVLKPCDESIVKPLSIIFNNCKLMKTFPNLWKNANVVPIHKKSTVRCSIRNHWCYQREILGKTLC